jgi:hypothetical protein
MHQIRDNLLRRRANLRFHMADKQTALLVVRRIRKLDGFRAPHRPSLAVSGGERAEQRHWHASGDQRGVLRGVRVLNLTHRLHRCVAPHAVVSSVVEPRASLLALSGSWLQVAVLHIGNIRPTDLCHSELTALTSRLSRQRADSHALRVRWRDLFSRVRTERADLTPGVPGSTMVRTSLVGLVLILLQFVQKCSREETGPNDVARSQRCLVR